MVRVVSAAVFLVMVVACRNETPPTTVRLEADGGDVVEAVELAVPSGCRESITDLATIGDRVETLSQVIDMVQDGACPPADEEHRLCRSLFLIGATDPLVGLGRGLDRAQVERLVAWHRWALADGIDAARGEPDIAEALRAIERLGVGGIVLGDDPSALADVAIARASPAIIESLAVAERVCLSLPR